MVDDCPGPRPALRPALRPASDDDSPGIISLIERCYAEYEGCVLDVDGEEPALRHPASSPEFSRFWVLVQSGCIVGTIACKELAGRDARDAVVELKKLYLDPAVRGQGWARRLIRLVEDHCRETGMRKVELWTDTRFATAHAVYTHLGYVQTGEARDLHDLSRTREYYFSRVLDESS